MYHVLSPFIGFLPPHTIANINISHHKASSQSGNLWSEQHIRLQKPFIQFSFHQQHEQFENSDICWFIDFLCAVGLNISQQILKCNFLTRMKTFDVHVSTFFCAGTGNFLLTCDIVSWGVMSVVSEFWSSWGDLDLKNSNSEKNSNKSNMIYFQTLKCQTFIVVTKFLNLTAW